MSKREKFFITVGFGIGLTPMVSGLCRELGWEGLILALVIIGGVGGSVAALFTGPYPTQKGNGDK